MSEAHVRLLAKMYKRRDEARLVLGDRYAATMAQGAEMIRGVMAKHGCNEVEAALMLGKEASDNFVSVMIVVASCVEMLEPSVSTPATSDEVDAG